MFNEVEKQVLCCNCYRFKPDGPLTSKHLKKIGRVSYCSIDVKTHNDHGSSYKIKHLIAARTQFRSLVHFASWQETWKHIGRYHAAEVSESSISRPSSSRKRQTLNWLGLLKPQNPSPWHTSPNKVIPPNPFQVVPLPTDQEIKYEPVGTILIQTTTEVLEDIWEIFSNMEDSFKVYAPLLSR